MNGAELRAIRKRLGFSQRKLADEIGMDEDMICNMERGRHGNGSPCHVEKRTALAVRFVALQAEARGE